MIEPLPIPVMDFDPVAFDKATGMFNDDEKWKYVRCLSHYWYQTHVQGIKDDDAGMRQLCNCDLAKWARLKGMIFDNDEFFYLENGKWHQKRARANYLKKQEDLIKRQAQTSIARTERTAQSVTKSIAKSVDFLEEPPRPKVVVLLSSEEAINPGKISTCDLLLAKKPAIS